MTIRQSGDRWNKMLPEARAKALALVQLATENGLPVMFWEGWRSPDATLKNIAAGTSKVADAFSSLHTWGVAFDIVFKGVMGEPVWPDATDPRWKQLAQLGESIGLKSGGLMWGWDWPHFQLPGYTASELKTEWNNDFLAFLADRGVSA